MKGFKYTTSLLGVLITFRVAFSQRSWPYFLAVALPWLLDSGQRTVRKLGRGGALRLRRHEASFYRFFSNFKVRVHVLPRLLFELVVRTFELKMSYPPKSLPKSRVK
jgi:hypothetical protein